ncbi:RNA polymerase sigma factor [Altererythrobacter lutimaris]|uniref:Sigma-70 family RNA polymerase sigma factor n=1 Tax=Altererythrobacter lutimaris TaxID=2743979 RepID=A0A850HE86_9SPHN|nr:sigma-70 family RNA polymerase sigma factor [Altererythrobacter lutimaris]NVE95148.1 sigma-70 family RNA polymerase sigma factor [Altererythrobacter lutimaris]
MAEHNSRKMRGRALDAYLVASAQAGSRTALNQLARRWHPKLLAHARRLTGEAELAEEAVQHGWSAIVRGISRLKEASAFPAWAYRIVSRSCAGEIGRITRRRKLAVAFAREPQATASEPIEPDEHSTLRAAIRELDPPHRAAIALYHFEELSVAEVAVALDIPAGTVKTRLMNARKKLRQILEGEAS